jgi:perosamine synthetase
MRLRRIPIVGTPIGAEDVAAGLLSHCRKDAVTDFEKGLAAYLGRGKCLAAGSGKAAFYLLLKALSALKPQKEVVIPAYTDAGLVLAIRAAGLKPVLCDISLESFQIDPQEVKKTVNRETLAVLAVHMFGCAADVPAIKATVKRESVFLIEDCAQSFGTSINGVMAGTIADAGFYSFNRGKNLPTFSGGALVTDSESLFRGCEAGRQLLKPVQVFSEPDFLMNIAALAIVSRPSVYSVLFPVLAPFKSNSVPTGFVLNRYSKVQAAVGSSLLGKIERFSQQRHVHGMLLLDMLKRISEFVLPGLLPGSFAAFNRFPVMVKDPQKRKRIQDRLWRCGIESSLMYPRPLHRVFDLGYPEDAFPRAQYFAEHVLTLPVHPFMRSGEVRRMGEEIIAVMEERP